MNQAPIFAENSALRARPDLVVFNRDRQTFRAKPSSMTHEKSAMMFAPSSFAALQQLQLVDHFVSYNRESLHASFDRIRINRHAMPTLRASPLQSGKIFCIHANLASVVKSRFRQLPAKMISVDICPNVGNPSAEISFASCHGMIIRPPRPESMTVRRPRNRLHIWYATTFSDGR